MVIPSGGGSHLVMRHLRLVVMRQTRAAGQQSRRSFLSFSTSSAAAAGRRVLQQSSEKVQGVTVKLSRKFSANGSSRSSSSLLLLKVPGKSTENRLLPLLSPGSSSGSVFCKAHFHTTPRRFNPIIAIIARQAAKVASIFLGRALRNWWAKLPPNKRELFVDFLRRHRLKLLAAVGLVVASFAYYYTSHIQETPITKRRRFIAFTPEQFEVLNKLEFDQQIETYKSKLLPTEHADTQRVGRVVKQLLRGNADIEQIKRHDWSVSVINDEAVMNAFVMPSGNIFVFSGLLKMVDNDEQLGIILAHEISHAILGHGLENISHQHIVDIVFISLLGFLWMFLPSDLIAAIGTAFSRFILGISFMTPYSKMLETEADEVGLLLAAKACFDVREASAFWHKMAIISGADPVHQLASSVEFLATHPSHEKRSEHLDGLLAEALKCRDDAQCSALPKEDPRERVQRMRDQIIRINKDKNIEGVLKI